ncbi:MAG: YmdB family metallophosphoesterase [Planctomycetes bacterium]|nr:YmdB family metallophosphoesterase [Planctomycetota bacterium]
MRVLCLGDLVGRPGRRAVRECLPTVRAEHAIDLVILNVENATNGAGIRRKEAEELLGYGVECLTTGDHVLDFAEVHEYLAAEPRLLRPINYEMPGWGAQVYTAAGGARVGVVNVCGHVFMKERCTVRNAFAAAKEAVEKLRAETPLVLVDMHAEATSEKLGMGWHLDGLASAVFGTHTHVQTADVQVLPSGTGYITDLGMCGPHFGIIGRDKDVVLKRFTGEEKSYMKVARRWIRLCGAVFELDCATGRCLDARLFRHDFEPADDPAMAAGESD